jgi:hypothetical protein
MGPASIHSNDHWLSPSSRSSLGRSFLLLLDGGIEISYKVRIQGGRDVNDCTSLPFTSHWHISDLAIVVGNAGHDLPDVYRRSSRCSLVSCHYPGYPRLSKAKGITLPTRPPTSTDNRKSFRYSKGVFLAHILSVLEDIWYDDAFLSQTVYL